MWIRSQGKEVLAKAMCLTAIDRTIYADNFDGDSSVTVARYESKERALEVMDYISNAIEKGKTLYSMPEK